MFDKLFLLRDLYNALRAKPIDLMKVESAVVGLLKELGLVGPAGILHDFAVALESGDYAALVGPVRDALKLALPLAGMEKWATVLDKTADAVVELLIVSYSSTQPVLVGVVEGGPDEFDVLADQLADLLPVQATTASAEVGDAVPVNMDPATIFAIIGFVIQAVKLWRERRKSA